MSGRQETLLELDPICVSSFREMKWILVAWAVNFAWVIGYCLVFGYGAGEDITLVLGMPSWVFWGVMLPWIVVTIFTAWFALTQMADHSLDDSAAVALEAGRGEASGNERGPGEQTAEELAGGEQGHE